MSTLVAPVLDAPPLRRYGMPSLERGASPAAAADFVQELPGQFFYRLLSVFCRLVADANAANREIVVEYRDDGDNRFALAGAPVTVAASTTTDYYFSAFLGQPDWSCDSTVLVPLPPLLLAPTYDFRIHVVSAQAGDQLSRIKYVWERFYRED